MPDAGRVITGVAKGVRLLAPGEGTRPLSDKVKQALFASLESELGEAWPVAFLDLFAGSGAAGIEALSRGAPRAVLVERDADVARIIRENLRRAGLDRPGHDRGGGAGHDRGGWPGHDAAEGNSAPELATGIGQVVRADVLRFLDGDAAAAGGPFGAVVLDPPYGDAAMLGALERLGDTERGWLAAEAVVVAKRFWRDDLPSRIGILAELRERRFGETVLSFFRADRS